MTGKMEASQLTIEVANYTMDKDANCCTLKYSNYEATQQSFDAISHVVQKGSYLLLQLWLVGPNKLVNFLPISQKEKGWGSFDIP